MPRTARERSQSGIYHIMVRGINKQDIFLDADDRFRYLETLAKVKSETLCRIYAYCLMTNHVHILLAEGQDYSVGQIMQRIGSSFALWYNRKYERVGYLFQDRFRSEPIETNSYLLAVTRYIHQNPVKAKITTDCSEYVWSSYLAYTMGKEHQTGLTDTVEIIHAVGGLERFVEFHSQLADESCCKGHEKPRATTRQILAAAKAMLGDQPLVALKTMDVPERNRILRGVKAVPGASCAQIAAVLGLGKKIVERA